MLPQVPSAPRTAGGTFLAQSSVLPSRVLTVKKPLVVAFAGKIGSGKTTITHALARVLGWRRVGFGDYVREVTRRRGLQPRRENLQAVGTQLLSEDMTRFCKSVLSSTGWMPGENLIIDGLRHLETVPVIADLAKPAELKIVFISVSELQRLRRLEGRGDGDTNSISAIERHSSELQVDTKLKDMADLTIDVDRPIDKILEEIIAWMRATTASQ